MKALISSWSYLYPESWPKLRIAYLLKGQINRCFQRCIRSHTSNYYFCRSTHCVVWGEFLDAMSPPQFHQVTRTLPINSKKLF
jgi:hypothetical protein